MGIRFIDPFKPTYLFHGLYGGGTRGTIRGLPLGPGEGCVEIVQA